MTEFLMPAGIISQRGLTLGIKRAPPMMHEFESRRIGASSGTIAI